MSLDAADVREGRILRFLWESGFCELGRLEAWADGLIARPNNPPYALTEIALAHLRGRERESLDDLLGDEFKPDEIILALGRIDHRQFALRTLCDALGTVSTLAVALELDPNTAKDEKLGLLHAAFPVHDSHYFLELGELTAEMLSEEISDYFLRVRAMAATIRAPS